jgi:hypothetical protein
LITKDKISSHVTLITLENLHKATNTMAKNKAPRLEDIAVDFYVCFKHIIGTNYFSMINDSMKT